LKMKGGKRPFQGGVQKKKESPKRGHQSSARLMEGLDVGRGGGRQKRQKKAWEVEMGRVGGRRSDLLIGSIISQRMARVIAFKVYAKKTNNC